MIWILYYWPIIAQRCCIIFASFGIITLHYSTLVELMAPKQLGFTCQRLIGFKLSLNQLSSFIETSLDYIIKHTPIQVFIKNSILDCHTSQDIPLRYIHHSLQNHHHSRHFHPQTNHHQQGLDSPMKLVSILRYHPP